MKKCRYAQKMEKEFNGYSGGPKWYGDLTNLLEIKKNGNCREFGWYLNRFRNVYIDGGLIPEKTFLIEVGSTKPDGAIGVHKAVLPPIMI